MNDSEIPAEAPPPYTKEPRQGQSLKVPDAQRAAARRSMEDEMRPLPQGWIRQFDAQNQHQFFVDTKPDPPRSIWHHPYDDEQYLSTLSSEERERLQELYVKRKKVDIIDEDTDEEQDGAGPSTLPQDVNLNPDIRRPGEKQSFGRRMKDKMTGTTHEQREAQRQQRAIEEQKAYEMHRAMRQAMSRAAQTGEPQFVAKDEQGRDIYVEPPQYNDRFYGGTQPANYRGVNPYDRGVYANPNARFIRPAAPYSARPYGYGYGGGLGLPLIGGLAGGLLLGGMLGGI